jgi:ppGpp synthetase/RelA/SpoT-type nucleotidyltranferase
MSGILAALKEMSRHYAVGNPNLLFYPPDRVDDLRILQKPFRSVIDKLYRRNVLYNSSYPAAPRDGFIEVVNFYEEIDDLLRTMIVCKYMDGPKYVCENLSAYCDSIGIVSHYRELSTDAGYYAWHFYFQTPVDLIINKIIDERRIWVEIQLTTQLAEVINSLTHGLYEARRSGRLYGTS